MSSEARTVRPFTGADELADALADWTLKVGPETIEADQTLSLSRQAFMIRPFELTFDADKFAAALQQGINQLELDPEDLELVVVASTPYLKFADVVTALPAPAVTATAGSIILVPPGDARPRALTTPYGGCDIDVYIALAHHIPKKPMRPSMKGTWLGTVRFSIRTDVAGSAFTPLPLGPAERKRLKLGDETLRYVKLTGDSALEYFEGALPVELYVDAKVLDRLAASPRSAVSRALQRQLVVDVLSAIVIASALDSKLENATFDEIKGSLLDRALEFALAGTPKLARHSEKSMLLSKIRTDPTWVIARLENAASLRKRTDDALIG